jgi:hypothetical protein
MKYLFYLILAVFALVGCKENTPEEPVTEDSSVEVAKTQEIPVPKGQQKLVGDFYCQTSDSIAVLTTRKAIYAVRFDEKAVQLNEAAQALKKEEYDMVQVTIHGTVEPNPYKLENGEGWDEMVTIKNIIEVSPASMKNVIRAGKNNAIQ